MNNTLTKNLPIPIIHPLVLRWKFNLKALWGLGLILIISLLVFYIFQVNAMVSKLYSLQNYEKKLNEIRQENKNLEIRSLQLNSWENIETLVKNLNFEKVGKVRYIRVLESSVVTK